MMSNSLVSFPTHTDNYWDLCAFLSDCNAPFQRPNGPHSLPSSQPSSANATNASSGGGSPFAPNSVPASNTAAAAGAFSRSAVRPRTPPHSQPQSSRPPPGGPATNSVAGTAASSSVDRSKLAEVQDLIHLEPAIYEDDVMRTLQARFFHQKYFVSEAAFIPSF